MKLKQITFILLLLVIGYSCKKEPKDSNVVDGIDLTQLPPATMTGANTMGCLINGEVWLPLKKNPLGKLEYNINFGVAGLSQGGGISVQAILDYNDDFEIMLIAAADVLDIGLFPHNLWTNKYLNDCGIFDLDTTFNNFIDITRLDFDNQIVSGLYQMQVVNSDCDTLIITEGRFDLSSE